MSAQTGWIVTVKTDGRVAAVRVSADECYTAAAAAEHVRDYRYPDGEIIRATPTTSRRPYDRIGPTCEDVTS
jgi:hypothetical protein